MEWVSLGDNGWAWVMVAIQHPPTLPVRALTRTVPDLVMRPRRLSSASRAFSSPARRFTAAAVSVQHCRTSLGLWLRQGSR